MNMNYITPIENNFPFKLATSSNGGSKPDGMFDHLVNTNEFVFEAYSTQVLNTLLTL